MAPLLPLGSVVETPTNDIDELNPKAPTNSLDVTSSTRSIPAIVLLVGTLLANASSNPVTFAVLANWMSWKVAAILPSVSVNVAKVLPTPKPEMLETSKALIASVIVLCVAILFVLEL